MRKPPAKSFKDKLKETKESIKRNTFNKSKAKNFDLNEERKKVKNKGIKY